MWPNLRWTLGDPLQGSYADSDDEEFRVLAAPLLTTGSITQAPQNLTDYSINLSELMTKPETIIESPGADCGDGHFSGHSNLSSHKSPNPSSRFRSDFKPTGSTSLHSFNSVPLASDSVSDKPQPVHGLFFQQIVRDSMDHSVLHDTDNPEFKRLCASASSLAATALATTTSEAYGRAWGRLIC